MSTYLVAFIVANFTAVSKNASDTLVCHTDMTQTFHVYWISTLGVQLVFQLTKWFNVST